MESYQYAILKDGKLHIQSYNEDILPITATDILQEQENDMQELTDKQDFDLSRITGKNLLTGQTVSLHNYMDKLQKKIKEARIKDIEVSRKRKTINGSMGLKRLLNKKLTLGKTSTGKRLVGKVIHVEKKKKSQSSEFLEARSGDMVNSSLSAEDIGFSQSEGMQLDRVDENEDTLGFGKDKIRACQPLKMSLSSF